MCEGGCIKGPAIDKMHIPKYKATMVIEAQIEKEAPAYPEEIANVDISKTFRGQAIHGKIPTEEQIAMILRGTGKYNRSQELNCGACGYSTCREKAIAVFQGKAEQEMCLPYVYEKAKSMSNVVLEMTPEIIMIVDAAFQIVEFNKEAEEVFGLNRAEAVNRMIFEIMDPEDFESVMKTHMPIERKRIDLASTGLVMLETIVYIEDQDAMLAIFQDITEEEAGLEHEFEMKMETVDIAQKVIDKQMMVAQEIAGLLGETTAETKVILTQLRDSLLEDEVIRGNRNRRKR
jgi:PAS domain S-box-containing protein